VTRGGRVGRGAYLLLALVIVAGALWSLTVAGSSGTPYAPSSTAPGGAKALALLLGQLGDEETFSGPLPAPGRTVALLLYDQLDDASRAQVTGWVRRGGTLVVADPTSPLEGASVAYGAPDQVEEADPSLAPGCQAPWVGGVAQVAPEGDPVLEVPSGAYGCFTQAGGAFAVATSVGRGVVVSLGGADMWSNAGLADEDNALLAADLLAPGRGYHVLWLTTPWVAGGNQDLWGLVPGRVKVFMAALAVAVLAACLWQGRRLGRPVPEDPLVPIPGSELVLATGRLLARNRRCDEVAALMRADLTARLRARFGQADGAEAATLASVVAAHSGLARDEVAAALTGPPPRDEQELMTVARSLQRIREEVLSGTTS
jgi:hypothetical protein